MGLKGKIWNFVEYVTGNYVLRSLPRGVDVFHDIEKYLPNQPLEILFDVGANIGQSAAHYTKKFPRAEIFCFEPIPESFTALQRSTVGNPRVHCFALALAAKTGSAEMFVTGQSPMNRLARDGEVIAPTQSQGTTTVTLQTLDEFCEAQKLTTIHYLKIDTEGSDLDVLRGAERMLGQQQIDLVEVEAGMNPLNTHHVPFCVLKAHLEEHGYFLFGIYEQIRERFSHEPHLRRTNPVFISQRAIAANRKPGIKKRT